MTTIDYSPQNSKESLNSLAHIAKTFKEIRETENEIRIKRMNLLEEINDHHYYGTIDSNYSGFGITIAKRNLPVKYQFSEVVDQLEKKLKEQKTLEIEDEIAIKEKRGFTWAITLDK